MSDQDAEESRVYGTSGGVPITDEVVEQLAAEAEVGYDLDRLMPLRPFSRSALWRRERDR